MEEQFDGGYVQLAVNSLRKLAMQQAAATARYEALLRGFGGGDFSISQYGASMLSLYLNEGAKFAGTVAEVGSDYVQSVVASFIKVGADPVTQAVEAAVRAADMAQTDNKPHRKGSLPKTPEK